MNPSISLNLESLTGLISRVRGGTCTGAASDPLEVVILRAMHLLQNENGFEN